MLGESIICTKITVAKDNSFRFQDIHTATAPRVLWQASNFATVLGLVCQVSCNNGQNRIPETQQTPTSFCGATRGCYLIGPKYTGQL